MKPRANHFKRHFFLGASFFAMVFLFFSHNANAATITWDGSSSTDWATAANWVGDAVPTSTDDVVINGSYTNAPILNLSAGAVTVNSLSVGSSATSVVTVSNGDIDTKKLIVTGDVTIGASGTLTHTANSSAETHRLSLQVGGNMTIVSGGSISINSKGYTGTSGNGRGPGAGGGGDINQRGSGGGHGGKGASTTTHAGGTTYDSITQPAMIGSSGGTCSRAAYGGAGGGAAKIVVGGTLTLEGALTAVGGNGITDKCSGGGSGGAIWVVAGNLTGAGSINANGGTSYNNDLTSASGGGGGRIAIEYTTSSFSGAITAFGKTGYAYGGAGTIYLKQGTNNGDLIVDNNSVAGADTLQLAGTNFTFDNVTITKSAKYVIPDTSSLAASVSLSANSVDATITVNSGGSMTLPASQNSLAYFSIANSGTVNVSQSNFSISNGTITNNGTITGISNLTLSSVTFYQNGTLTGITDLIVGASSTFEFQNLNASTPFNLSNLTVLSGGTITHKANSSTETYTLNLNISGDFDLQSGGAISLNGRGYVGKSGTGYGPGAGAGGDLNAYGAGGGYGGKGGNGRAGLVGGSPYGSIVQPVNIGSSGGAATATSGSGGGAVKIIVGGLFNINGTISANGTNGLTNDRSGGGSGGGIWINANTIGGGGSISANGGNAYNTYGAGGGGGGRIAVEYLSSTFSGTYSSSGGTGYNAGNAGTIRTGSLSAEVLSSPYDSGSGQNVIAKLQWTETLPAGTDAKFQIRTAPDNGGAPGTWTSWMGPNGTSGTYFTDPSGGEDIPAALEDGANDQWMQYRVLLSSPDLSVNPVVGDVSLFYVVNQPPSFDATFGTDGINLSQVSSSVDPQWGKMKIEYAVRDVDTTSGTVTQNYATPSFEYSFDGSNWTAVNSAYVTYSAPAQGDVADVNGDGKMDNKMLEGSYLTYAAYWNAKSQIPETYSESIRVRITLTDNEIANSTVQAIGNIISVDTKNPTLASVPMHVHANSVPASVSSDVTDDNSLQMRIGLATDISDASWESYAASKQLALATNPDIVYAQYRDAFGNSSVILSAQTPEQPATVMIQDTSNMHNDLNEYRLFVAWKTIATPEVGFGSYYVYRSENQTDWTHVGTVNERLTNYYGDNSVQGNVNYYYRVASVDSSGDISYVSAIVNGVANGNVDAGEGGGGTGEQPPVISNVTVDNITPTSAQINWTTDVIATSTVGFSTQPSHFENEVGSGSMVTSHSVTLSSLTPNTQYYFQTKSANASNALAVDTNGGNGYTFSTSAGDSTAPIISNITVANTTASTATITWDTNEAATSFVEYSKTNGFSTGAQFGDVAMTTSHSVTVPSLEQGTTYYFKVRSKDAANNEGISAQSSFDTLVSGDVTSPQISGLSSTPSFNSATVTWTTDEDATSYVEYGSTTSYGRIYGDNNPVKSHTVQLPYDLSSEQTYHFRVRSSDGSYNEAISSDNTFTTTVNPADSTAPLIANINIGTPDRDSVTVTWNTDESATSYVGYSSDGGDTFSEQGYSTLTTFHSVTLAGLTPGTTYLLKISSADASGNKAIDDNAGSYYQRATAPGPMPPVFSSVSSLNLDEHRTTVSWSTDLSSTSLVEYGLDNNYGSVSGKLDDKTSHSVTLEGLLPSTTYHFRVRSTDEVEGVSGDYTFSTTAAPDTQGPAISAISSTNISKDGARITWTTDEDSNSLVSYGQSSAYSMAAGDRNTMVISHAVDLDRLSPSTTYHYQITSTDSVGNTANSSDQTLTTIADTSDPVISDLEVRSVSETGAVISWKTDKQASTKINYGVDHDLASNYDAQINSDVHVISLTGLAGGQKYYFKAVSVDEYGNSVESTEQTFTTLTDPELSHDPLESISDIPDSPAVLTDTKAVIDFSTDQRAQCFIEYGTQAGQYTEVPIGESTYDSKHSLHLAGLIYQTKYYYRVTCSDNLDTIIMSDELSFTTLEKQVGESETGEEEIADRIAPSISNVSVKTVASESTIISWDTDENANSMIRFGTSSTYGKMTGDDSVNKDSANYVQKHEVTVDRLVPGTKYYFEAMSLDTNGNIGKSSQGTFTTEGTSTISSIVSESKELGKATVMWLTQVPADTYLEYGVSTKYGSEIKQSSLTKEHQVELSGLKGGSIYHFRIKGTDAEGNIYTSADSTFAPKSPPKVRDLQAVHVSEHSATITFTADVPVTATVNYQDTRKEKEAQSKGNPNLGTKQEIILNDLESGLTYSYAVTVRDENGLETISEAKTFVTGKDTTAPLIDQVKTESALTQNDKVQSIISWKTDELATGALVYREGKNGEEKEIKVSDVLSQQHVAVVTSFNQGSVYYFRVKAVDASDNEAVSSDYALLTPKTKENIVQVIISNFYDIFRWTRR